MIAAGYLGQIVGAIGFGFVSELFGRKVAFIASSLLFGLLSLVATFAWSVESLLAFRLIQGIGLGAEVSHPTPETGCFGGCQLLRRRTLEVDQQIRWRAPPLTMSLQQLWGLFSNGSR